MNDVLIRWRPQLVRGARVASLALVLAACAACSESELAGPQREAAANAVPVVTVAAMTKPMGVAIEAVGTANANESVSVTSQSSNIVSAIRFQEGELVKRGAVLIELDSDEERAALAEAQATLAESESQFRRSRDLYTQQALSHAQLDQIEATLKANRARVEAAQARLAETQIRAGFAGRTGFRRVSIGSLVSPGTVITTLDDTSVMKLDFTVPETFLYVLQKGLPVTARAPGLPDRAFEGKITNIDSRIDPVTRSLTVRAEIPNRDGVLRPGMFMTVNLQGNVVPTLLVPEAAIVPEQGNTYVFVVQDGVTERRPVKLGRRRPGEVEITLGLKEGERVVVEGTQNIREGTQVREERRDESGATS